MAILGELQVTIQSHNQDLPEYLDPEAPAASPGDPKKVYVEAEPGAAFVIHVKCSDKIPHADDICGITYHVFIDGVMVKKTAADGLPLESWLSSIRCDENGSVSRKMLFAPVATIPGAQSEVPMSEASNVGTIEVRIYRVITRREVPVLSDYAEYKKLEDRAPVAEKALIKGSNSLTTSFGPAEPVGQPRTHYNSNYFDSRKNPFATFKFLYRTREALEMMGIIDDGVPVQIVNREEPPVESLSREELEDLVRRQRLASDTGTPTRGVKREINDDEDVQELSHRCVKRERVRTKGKGTIAQPVEIIDLDD